MPAIVDFPTVVQEALTIFGDLLGSSQSICFLKNGS